MENQYLEINGASILGLVDTFSFLIPISKICGGRCRIRTHVSGSEGRKDIQTTLIARVQATSLPFLNKLDEFAKRHFIFYPTILLNKEYIAGGS